LYFPGFSTPPRFAANYLAQGRSIGAMMLGIAALKPNMLCSVSSRRCRGERQRSVWMMPDASRIQRMLCRATAHVGVGGMSLLATPAGRAEMTASSRSKSTGLVTKPSAPSCRAFEFNPSEPKLVISESGVGYRLVGNAASLAKSGWEFSSEQ
jgi:hypothetical protein